MDGAEFITSVVKPNLVQRCGSPSLEANGTFHVVMNLPSLAVDFLKYFRGLLCDITLPTELCASLLPVIHCYTFSRADDPVTDAADRTAAKLSITSFEELQDRGVRVVRNVAPGKEMLCVVFRLPWHVLTTNDHCKSCFHRVHVRHISHVFYTTAAGLRLSVLELPEG